MTLAHSSSDVFDETNNEESGVTAALSTWIAGLKREDIPTQVLERAKHLILDGIACGLVGARVPWSEKAAAAILDFEPEGQCSVLGYEEKLGPLAAALLNGAFIQATELDDYHSVAPLHSASVVLPALLAAAQVRSTPRGSAHNSGDHRTQASGDTVSGIEFLIAAVVGFETGPRSGAAMHGADLLLRGWHSGPIFGCPAAAAASSKLLGLSADNTESAIGIACTQAGGLMAAQYEGMIKRVQHAFAARNGLLGALLARNDYVGIKKVFERRYGGFLSMFSQGNGKTPPYDVRKVTEGLGDVWQTSNIRVKLHACVGGCHGQIEALEKLQAAHPARFAKESLGRIISIKVGLSGPIFAHDGWEARERPLSATGAQMNAAYIGATQLVDSEVLIVGFSSSKLDRDEVWNLVYKTSCYHDAQFDKPNHGCGARVIIEFDDGVTVEETVQMPRGFDPPITDEEIRKKFRKLVISAIDQQRMERIEKLVLGMDQLDDVSALIQVLASPTQNVLA
ncbi:putative SpoK [Seiridium unicorne]|uniref:SpoK n=1 Tax=Seiridium unicorne TaxID=138068 RepID=A0ABR2VBZ2_9PEZI